MPHTSLWSPVRLVQGSLGLLLADHAARAARRDDRPGSRRREARHGSNVYDEEDRHRHDRAGTRRNTRRVTLQLCGHPFSSCTMKALIALCENEMPFDFQTIDPDHPENAAEPARRWSLATFPLLVDGGTVAVETSVIIKHLAAFHAGPVSLILVDGRAAVPVPMLDRVLDNHVMRPVQAIVFDARRPENARCLRRHAGPNRIQYDLRMARSYAGGVPMGGRRCFHAGRRSRCARAVRRRLGASDRRGSHHAMQ